MTTDGWIAALALLSLAVSVWVFAQQRMDRQAERAVDTKRDDYRLLLDFYVRWLAADEQRCRKELYRASDAGVTSDQISEENLEKINHALAMLNLVAVQRRLGNCPRGDSDILFGSTVLRCADAAEGIGYFKWRAKMQGTTPWQDLRDYAHEMRSKADVTQQSDQSPA